MAAASAPIERQIAQAQANQAGALQQIGATFSNLQPRVEAGTQFVQQSFNQALGAEQGIYDAANQRLAQMREGRAADAQKMAQMIGGPVAIGEFTAGVEPSQQYLAQSGAGQLLHSLGLAQAGVQEAEAFSGKVFPLLRTEQEADARNKFSQQISELQGQLSDIQSRKTSTINSTYTQRLQDERNYALQQSQMQLDRLKADRDWKATLASLKTDKAKLALAQSESRRAESILTGKYKGKPTQAAIAQTASIADAKRQNQLKQQEINANIAHMTASDRAEAARLGLSARELATREWEIRNNAKLNNTKLNIAQRQSAMEIVDAALSGGTGKTITTTVPTEVDRTTAIHNRRAYGRVWKVEDGGDGKVHYWLDREIKQPGAAVPKVQDPEKLYEMLIGYNIPAKMAENIVESRLNVPTFQPGKIAYSAQELKAMPFSQLRGVAIKLGFVPRGNATRNKMVNFVTRRVAQANAKR
jgi:hypothetical protein